MTTIEHEPVKDAVRNRAWNPQLLWWLMTIPAWLTSAYAVQFMLGTPAAGSAYKAFILLDPIAKYHIWAAVGALAIGPLQLSSRMRRKHRVAHRWLGRYYVVAALTGAIAALFVAKHSATVLGVVGVATLGVLWFSSTTIAWVYIRQRNVNAHRTWMTISYSLCYGAVILRSAGPLLTTYGVSLATANTIELWSWVIGPVFVALQLWAGTVGFLADNRRVCRVQCNRTRRR